MTAAAHAKQNTRPPQTDDTGRVTGDDDAARSRGAIGLALVLVAVVVRHLAALRAPFFADDYLFLDQVRGHSLLAAIASPDPIGNFLRPVSRPLYFGLVTQIGGENAALFHGLNLWLFVVAVVLLYIIARRLAGGRAALVAAAVLGLSYAADVPLWWCSGSQDLLAMVFALATIALSLAGRRVWAAAALAMGLLSKETVALTPLIVMLLDLRRGESLLASFRRNVWVAAVAAAWACVWIATASSRPAAASVLQADPLAFPATLVHLVQTALGLEWTLPIARAGFDWPALAAAVIAGLGLLLAARKVSVGPVAAGAAGAAEPAGAAPTSAPGPATAAKPARVSPWLAGLAWALLGALPIVAVAGIWSAYFYLFAICGIALALGAAFARLPRWAGAAAIVILGASSALATSGATFTQERSAWSRTSHVNRAYILRATAAAADYLDQLRNLHPSLPKHSTLYFGSLKSYSGFQIGDGALLRWAYRDSTLRSHYLTDFSAAASSHGPRFFVYAESGVLRDYTNDPSLYVDMAYSMMLNRKPQGAVDALRLELARDANDPDGRYWLAWNEWAAGDSAAAQDQLAADGYALNRDAGAALAGAQARLAGSDTTGVTAALLQARKNAVLDPEPHLLLASLWIPDPAMRRLGVMEACAALALAPERAAGWGLLATAQLDEQQLGAGAASLREFIRLGGDSEESVGRARQVLASLEAVMAGRNPAKP